MVQITQGFFLLTELASNAKRKLPLPKANHERMTVWGLCTPTTTAVVGGVNRQELLRTSMTRMATGESGLRAQPRWKHMDIEDARI